MSELHALAAAIGLVRVWWDVAGRQQEVTDEALGAIATALGYPADSAAAIATSLARIDDERRRPPVLLVADTDRPIQIPASLARAELVREDGTSQALSIDGGYLPAIAEPGYYRLSIGSHELTLAPSRRHAVTGWTNFRMGAGSGDHRSRSHRCAAERRNPMVILAISTTRWGVLPPVAPDVVMINPVHALFPGHGIGFSPYSPSSRLFLNGAMGDPALVGLPPLPPGSNGDTLIDWESALPTRLAQLRTVFNGLTPEFRSRVIKDSLCRWVMRCAAMPSSMRSMCVFGRAVLMAGGPGLSPSTTPTA